MHVSDQAPLPVPSCVSTKLNKLAVGELLFLKQLDYESYTAKGYNSEVILLMYRSHGGLLAVPITDCERDQVLNGTKLAHNLFQNRPVWVHDNGNWQASHAYIPLDFLPPKDIELDNPLSLFSSYSKPDPHQL